MIRVNKRFYCLLAALVLPGILLTGCSSSKSTTFAVPPSGELDPSVFPSADASAIAASTSGGRTFSLSSDGHALFYATETVKSDSDRSYVIYDGVTTQLSNNQPGFDVFASDVSGNGHVAGTKSPVGDASHAVGFLVNSGTVINLPNLPGGTFTRALGVNDAGDVVGSADTTVGGITAVHAFLYHDGMMTDLGTLGGGTSSARRINKSGTIVGTAQLPNGQTHACSWINKKPQDLGTLGAGTFSQAADVNDAGQIVGYSDTTPTVGATGHAFLYVSGSLQDLGSPSGISYANAINNNGFVVGNFILPSGGTSGVAWYKGSMTDLNNSIYKWPAGLSITSALGVCDNGAILGLGLNNGSPTFVQMTIKQ